MEDKGLFDDEGITIKRGMTEPIIYKVTEYYDWHNCDHEVVSNIFINKEYAEDFLKKRVKEISKDVFGEDGVIWCGVDIKRRCFEVVKNYNGSICVNNDNDYVTLFFDEDRLNTSVLKSKDNPELNKKYKGLWGNDFSLLREDYDGYIHEMKKVIKDVASYTISYMDKEGYDLKTLEDENNMDIVGEFHDYVHNNNLDYKDMWESISVEDMEEIQKSYLERKRDEVWKIKQERGWITNAQVYKAGRYEWC